MSTKKESINAYKQMKFKVGIFQIKNQCSNKTYLGTSSDLDRAFNADKFQLNAGLHRNKDLQSDWNKLGSNAFSFSIMDELKVEVTATKAQIQTDLNVFRKMLKNELMANGEEFYE